MAGLSQTQRVGPWAAIGSRPGFRTFASPGFRRLVGLLLIGVGLVYLTALLAAVDRAGGFEVDYLHAYRRASLALVAGHSPYLPEQLAAPFPATGRYGWYLYPPALAQALTPVAILPEGASAAAWFVLQVAMLFAAAWLPASVAGAPRTVDRVIWTFVAILFFLPVHEVLWTGNMGGPFALGAAALLASGVGARRSGQDPQRVAAGVLVGAVAVFKLSPFVWLPAAFRAGRGLARGSVLAVAGITIASVALAPQAWLDYGRVLRNLLAGDVRYPNNLAPAIVALNLGSPQAAVDVTRSLALLAAFAFLAASVWFARAAGAWPFAVACAIAASLLVPAALWYHYLVLLLPLAAFAWVRGRSSARTALLAGGVLVSIGMTMPFIAEAGLLATMTTILAVLRPSHDGRAGTQRTAEAAS